MMGKYKPERILIRMEKPNFDVDAYIDKTIISIPCSDDISVSVEYESYGYDLNYRPVSLGELINYIENKDKFNEKINADKAEIKKLTERVESLKEKLSECRKQRESLANVIEIKRDGKVEVKGQG